MEGYVRFSNSCTSPQPSRAGSARYPCGADSDSDSEPLTPVLAPLREERDSWFPSIFRNAWARLNSPTTTPYESQYLTLIPLSGMSSPHKASLSTARGYRKPTTSHMLHAPMQKNQKAKLETKCWFCMTLQMLDCGHDGPS